MALQLDFVHCIFKKTCQKHGISETGSLRRSRTVGRWAGTYSLGLSQNEANFHLTPCSRALLEKLRAPQPNKKLPAFCVTLRPTTLLTTARHLSECAARRIQSTPSYQISLTFWSRNYFLKFSTPVYKVRIKQEPNKLEL